jgi:hypothetical protein
MPPCLSMDFQSGVCCCLCYWFLQPDTLHILFIVYQRGWTNMTAAESPMGCLLPAS